jgi:hypothetical protein
VDLSSGINVRASVCQIEIERTGKRREREEGQSGDDAALDLAQPVERDACLGGHDGGTARAARARGSSTPSPSP